MNPLGDAIMGLAWTQFWQVTLVAIIVGFVVKLACRRRPHLAYILWMVVLLKALTPPLWSSPTSVFSWTARGPEIAANTGLLDDLLPSAVAVETRDNPAPSPLADRNGASLDRAGRTDLQAIAGPLAMRINKPDAMSASGAMSSRTIAATILALVWLAGAASYACYTLLTVIGCWRVTRRCQIPIEEPISVLTTGLSQRLRMRRPVRLSIVEAPVGPMSFGWLRPTIVIPQALLSSKSIDDLEPILAHELIHVRRGDGLVGFLQLLVQCLWWFHPLIWLMNRNICCERERCCDEEVIAELAYEPRRYGRSLLGVLELKRQLRLPQAVPGIRPFEVTRRRLEYLATYSKHFRRRTPRSYWLVLLVGLFLVAPGAGVSRFENRGSAVASQPAPPKTSALSEGWAVKGRIVDHRGVAVPKAEVLLLGEERIFVDADRRNWFVLRTEKGQLPNPPSTRTNSDGEFSIERTEGVPNRLAVISADPLFWVVSRDKLTDGEKVEIKLPPSGSLAIDCDLPGKSAKQPVNIELRTFDDVNWNADVLRFHFGSFSVKNPGETVFEHLPPGKYAIQRNQETKTGDQEMLIGLADRKLVEVESNKRAVCRIDRKIGRPLTGRVRGLENIDLRHAHVSINYFGPEEEPGRDGKPIRYMTIFDVIPITSDGHFTTDPIPAGEYHLFLSAMRSTTSNQSPQQSDYEGQSRFTVPQEGDMPTVEVVAKPRRERNGPKVPGRGGRPAAPDAKAGTSLRVVDEQGNPIPKFEIKVWTAVRGSSIWLIGSDGQIAQNQPMWGFDEVEAIDVTVRAAGYASTIKHFAGPERDKLLRGEATVVMRHGEEVQVRFRLPPGVKWPDGLKPDLYFDDLKNDVRIMWQPSNRLAYRETGLPDFDMLNVASEEPGTATVRLASDTAPFRVAIYSPGFLQLFECGPFTMADVKAGILEIGVENPAALDVHFDVGGADVGKLPFDSARISVMWKIPETSNSYLVVASPEGTEPQQELRIADLPAGDYMVSVRTKAKPGVENLPNAQAIPINPGAFFASKNVSLEPGHPNGSTFTTHQLT